MTSKQKAKKLHEIADALEEWGKYNEKVTNVAEWGTSVAKQIIRKAMTLLVDNLVLLNECKNKYGCYSPLQQCFVAIEQAASWPKTKDLGDCKGWTNDFTECRLWGGEQRSLADECVRYANEVDKETERGREESKKKENFYQTNTFKFVIIPLLVALFLGIPSWLSLRGKMDVPKTEKSIVVPDPNNYSRTPLYFRTKKRVDDFYESIRNEKLDPWLFINVEGVQDQVTQYNGDTIYISGTFSGSKRLIFWSDDFIPPFIKDAIIKVFDQTIDECRTNGLEPQIYVYEAKRILSDFIYRIYNHMADMDQKLLKQVYPERSGRRDVKREIEKMCRHLDGQYEAALLLASKGKNTN